jgi:hypothetical protein
MDSVGGEGHGCTPGASRAFSSEYSKVVCPAHCTTRIAAIRKLRARKALSPGLDVNLSWDFAGHRRHPSADHADRDLDDDGILDDRRLISLRRLGVSTKHEREDAACERNTIEPTNFFNFWHFHFFTTFFFA